MIRVLNVLFDDRYGGPQKRVIDVAGGLLSQGVETLLLLPAGNGNASELAEEKGLKVFRVPFNRMPKPKEILKVLRWAILLPKDIYLILKVIKGNEIDVVHVNGAFFLAPAFAAKLCRTALVWHLNDTVVSSGLAKVFSMIVRMLADEVVVAAEAVATHYNLGRTSYRVIYAPVNVETIVKKSTYTQIGATKRVGLVGNWNPLKGLDVFVEAASLVNAELGAEIEFSIAGSRLDSHADYAEKVDQLIHTKKLDDTIHCEGFVDNIPSFLQGLDVLVLSSWSEACPMGVLEAMAAGVPVVATDVGGVKELLHPETESAAGFVVPAGDSAKIAAKVLILLKDEGLCKEMGMHGRASAEQRFSLETCVNSHLKTYQDLIGV